jgi:hypothetical protein
VNARRRKNFIHSVSHDSSVLVLEDRKAHTFYGSFEEILGTPVACSCAINFSLLDLPRVDLSHLGECFTEEEVWVVIRAMSADKAPSPDDFTMRFLQVA